MAKLFLPLIICMVLAAGCQQSTVNAPAANLDAPVVLAPPPKPIDPAPKVTTSAPNARQKPRIAGVPDDWVPNAAPNRWKWIVIHHSATPTGSAVQFDRSHKAKGWDELGYHFVIGNGTGSKDGQIEVGPRWPKQKWGAHARTANQEYNNFGIGICLVGDFDIDRPSAAQIRGTAKLVAHLMKTYNVPASRVIGHGETKATVCPGRYMNVAEVRRQAAQLAAIDLDEPSRPSLAQGTDELLYPSAR